MERLLQQAKNMYEWLAAVLPYLCPANLHVISMRIGWPRRLTGVNNRTLRTTPKAKAYELERSKKNTSNDTLRRRGR